MFYRTGGIGSCDTIDPGGRNPVLPSVLVPQGAIAVGTDMLLETADKRRRLPSRCHRMTCGQDETSGAGSSSTVVRASPSVRVYDCTYMPVVLLPRICPRTAAGHHA